MLVYSGKLDFICNYFGGRAWTNATKWSGQVCVNSRVIILLHTVQEGFQNAAYQDWKVDGALVCLASHQNCVLL